MMQRLVWCLLLLPALAFAAGNESINTLPVDSSNQPTAAYFSQTRTFLNQEDAARCNEQRLGGFVVSGGIHATAGSTTSPAFAMVGYTSSCTRVNQASVAINYTTAGCAASDTAWVIASASSSDTLSNFNRVSGTEYFVDCTSATQPALPADSVWLMQVTIAGSAITAVTRLSTIRPVVSPPELNVKDYGALGDNSADDTAAIRAAISAIPATGGLLYFPAGEYRISAALTVTDKPVTFAGEGPHASRIVQTAAADGINYTATLPFNYTLGLTRRLKLHVRDLAVLKATSTAGVAIRGAWVAGSDPVPTVEIENVFITEHGSTGTITWTKGIELTNAAAPLITNVQITGDQGSEANTAVPNPFSMTHCINMLAGTTAGQIHQIFERLHLFACNAGIAWAGWHEGIFVRDSEIVFVQVGLEHVGFSTPNNPNFMVENVHIATRQTGAFVQDVLQAWFVNVDIYKATGGATGFTGNGILVAAAANAHIIGSKLENIHSAANNNGVAITNNPRSIVAHNHFIGWNGSGIILTTDNNIVDGNVLENSPNCITLAGNNNIISDSNRYISCSSSNVFNSSGTGNYYATPTRRYHVSITPTLTGGAPTATLDVAIPSGVFASKPSVAFLMNADAVNDDIIGFYQFDSGSTTATNARFRLATRGGGNITAGIHRFSFQALE